MANQFNSILTRIPKYNKFNLSFENKFTAPMGKLIPVMTQEVIPGDFMNINVEHLIKFQPMTAPIMQRVDVYFHAFFVPLRIIWPESEDFFTGGKNGLKQVKKPTINWDPRATLDDCITPGTLHDYLGFPTVDDGADDIPPELTDRLRFDALPFRAYNQIWNDYYRDQNLTEEVDVTKIGATDDLPHYEDGALPPELQLRTRCYSKDYFTSALPEPQRGPEVTLPIESSATVRFTKGTAEDNYISPDKVYNASTGNTANVVDLGTTSQGVLTNSAQGRDPQLALDNSKNLRVDVESSTTTIEDFRRALKVQEWYEKMNRGGYRYIEQILNFFGVRSSDARLQRAEYLGGMKSPVIVSQVTQTSQTNTTRDNESTLGDWAGNAASLSSNKICKRRFEEHGFLMVIMSVIPKASYFQGLPRKYMRFDKTDYYWPQFAHVGDQEIKKGELVYSFKDAGEDNDEGFGYSPRNAEYRYNPDEIHGEFKTNLLYWHMGRKFAAQPSLNNSFMEVGNDEIDRVFGIESTKANPLLCQVYFNVYAKRKIARYGNPRI